MADHLTLEQVSDELYAGPPDEFVARRNERAKQARAAKDRELATSITALRRPSRSAWMVNLLARSEPDQLAGLLDLGEALRQAQEQLSGPDLRRLSADRHRAVEALTRRAVALAAEQDATATEAIRREISQSLQAALADPETAASVRAGTLTQAADYSGFGPFTPGAAVSHPETRESTEPEDPEPEQDETEVDDTEARAEAARVEREAREAREAALATARQELDAAEAAVEHAQSERDGLSAEVDEAAAALAALEDRLQQAEHSTATAEQERDEARERLAAIT